MGKKEAVEKAKAELEATISEIVRVFITFNLLNLCVKMELLLII